MSKNRNNKHQQSSQQPSAPAAPSAGEEQVQQSQAEEQDQQHQEDEQHQPGDVIAEAEEAQPLVSHTPDKPTRASMFVEGFRFHHSFVCGQERGGAGGCRNSVEQWHSPNNTPIIVDAMAGDNSPWIVHSTHCPAAR